jgi:hypothetical protein
LIAHDQKAIFRRRVITRHATDYWRLLRWRVDNQAMARALTVMTDDRFADHCRKEAKDCEREAERTVSPLDKELWLRLSREWTKLAGPASPPRVNRRT